MDFEHLLSHAIADGNVPASLRTVWTTMHSNDPDLAQRTLVAVVDAGTGQHIGDEPDHASPHVANPVSSFATVDDAAEALHLSTHAAVRLANIEDDIAAAAAPPNPDRPDCAWLDYRPLAAPPRPWSDEDAERDLRRAQAADVPLDRDTWAVYAELGLDAVSELWNDRQRQQVDQLMDWRSRFIDIEQGKFSDARDVERAHERAAEIEAERMKAEKARKRELFASNRQMLGLIHPLDPHPHD